MDARQEISRNRNTNDNTIADEYYDSIARGYDELHGEEQLQKLSIIKHHLHADSQFRSWITPQTTLLDVGCGTGIATTYFPVRNAIGIDPSEKLINIARKKNNECEFIVAPAEHIPYHARQFDIVISLTAIQNFKDIHQGLKEMKRVGKKYILTYLKQSKKSKQIEQCINDTFQIMLTIEEEKDKIYFCE